MDRTGVRRDAKHIELEYNQEKWPRVEGTIEAVVAREGDRPPLSRVLAGVARTEWFGKPSLSDREHVFGGRLCTVPGAVAFGGQSALVREHIIAACSEETDLVIELGAGWSWHLLSAWVGGAPRSATYVAAEYTEAGPPRVLAPRGLGSGPRIPRDRLRLPSAGTRRARASPARRGVTQHSIEQIQHVPDALFDAIRGVAERVSCLHFEPVGWQTEQDGRTGSSADLRRPSRLQPQPGGSPSLAGGGRPAATRRDLPRGRGHEPAKYHQHRPLARLAGQP